MTPNNSNYNRPSLDGLSFLRKALVITVVAGLSLALCIGVVVLILLPFLPELLYLFPVLCDAKPHEKISTVSSLLYTVITFIMLIAIAVTAVFAYKQLKDIGKARRLSFLMELWKYYTERSRSVYFRCETPLEVSRPKAAVATRLWRGRLLTGVKHYWG